MVNQMQVYISMAEVRFSVLSEDGIPFSTTLSSGESKAVEPAVLSRSDSWTRILAFPLRSPPPLSPLDVNVLLFDMCVGNL